MRNVIHGITCTAIMFCVVPVTETELLLIIQEAMQERTNIAYNDNGKEQ